MDTYNAPRESWVHFILWNMNTEILKIAAQLEEAYEGDPWFGKSVTALMKEVDEANVFQRPGNQHSILELIWHMVNWKEFTISRLHDSTKPLGYFEENDWRQLDHSNKSLWEEGCKALDDTQRQLISLLKVQEDSILETIVPGRDYQYKNLLYGIIQHDVYHLGQIAYINKLLKNE